MHEKLPRAGSSKWFEGQRQGYYVTRYVHCKRKKGKGQKQLRNGSSLTGTSSESVVYRARHRMEGQEVCGSTIRVSFMPQSQERQQSNSGKEALSNYSFILGGCSILSHEQLQHSLFWRDLTLVIFIGYLGYRI